MSMRSILITGGAGFIGSHIAKRCIEKGIKVTIVDNLSTGNIDNIPKQAEFIKFNISNPDHYKKISNKFDAVFHLAAQSSGEISRSDPILDFQTNVLGTILLLNWCFDNSIKRFMYSSSMAAYGNPKSLPVKEEDPTSPISFYGISKLTSEFYIKKFEQLGLDTTIFRLFSVYGPGQNLINSKQGIVSIFLKYILDGKEIHVKGAGDRSRDFTYIDDVVYVWMMSLNNPISFDKTYNICTKKQTLISELVEAELTAMGKDKKSYPVRYEGETPDDQFGIFGDNSKICQDFGDIQFTSLNIGLEKMVQWAKK